MSSKLVLVALILSLTGSLNWSFAQPSIEKLQAPVKLTSEQFSDYQKLIKPAADELPWAKISWHASVWEARKQAVAEGKPILIWAGGGSAPLGVC